MNKLLLLLFLLLTYIGNAQDTEKSNIYLDENLKQISQSEYLNKKWKSIYGHSQIENDSLITHKLQRKYFFGKLEKNELSQVQKLLQKYLGINDFDKNIVLMYKDSLLSFEETAKKSDSIRLKNGLNELTLKEYSELRKGYDKKQKKCLKFAKKHKITPRYLFNYNDEYDYQPRFYNSNKIPSALKLIFFKTADRGCIILKPNGDYFFYTRITQDFTEEFINDDWDPYIKEFNAVYSGSKTKLDFIEKMNEEFESKMRRIAMNNPSLKRQKDKVIASYSDKNKRIQRVRLQMPPNCYGYASY